ncbi:MAG: extracellular solute-binding protein [Gammaproteobacteria bacterium]|nr:extracellular solute-binding protein [Gammaproteobacteria bacterium]
MSHVPKKGKITRRQVLKTGAAGIALTSAIGIAPKYLFSPSRAQGLGLAAGMTGGPTGFEGAERYQYNETHSEGRAIEGLKRLKAAGKAPDKLNILMTDGGIGHFTKPYPATSTLGKDIFEKETGIEINFTGVSPENQLTRVVQDVTTKSGAFDIYTHNQNALGDLGALGAVVPLDDLIDKYGADFNDRKRGTPTPEIYELLYKYGGETLSVSLDGDFQTWVYRKDLFDDPQNKKEFEDQYGMELDKPKTWEQTDAIADFFTKKGLFGNGNMMSPFWGISTWYNRYVSKALPNFFLFDEEGKPQIDTELGIQATQEHINSFKWAPPDALSWSWAEYYGQMANLKSVMIATFTNLPKFNDRLDADGKPATPLTGKLGSFLPPGHQFGSQLVRRSTHYLGNNGSVSTQSKYPEAAYLFLQWAGSTRIFTWLTANPGGFFDPFQLANFEDPLVIKTYHDYHVPVIRETIKRSVPTMNYPGAASLHNALDENVQAAMVGGMTAKEAMERTAKDWRRSIKKRGETKMIDAINADRSGWPTLIDAA